jgi:DNA-binding transcriptional regulator YdaS (Cro superfamily)
VNEGSPARGDGRGRRWTHHRLRVVLGVAFGVNARGRPDTAAAAVALGVSRRTVQRWLHGADRTLARLPAGRLTQVQRATRPDEESLRQEETAARYARGAIERIAAPEDAGVLPAWRQRQWLEPHVVAVLELPGLGLRQVAISRASDRTLPDLRKRGRIRTHTTVATRFHATALAYALLQQVDPWRVQSPAGVVKQGRTQTWLAAAPALKLPEMAAAEGLA